MPAPVAVGLDIGNNKCVISVVRNGVVDAILNLESSRETPTVVHFASDHRLFGTAATQFTTIGPDSTISQIKRLVGRRFDGTYFQNDRRRFAYTTEKAPDGSVAVTLPHYLGKEQKFTALEILTMLMSHLKQIAERATGAPVSHCVIGVPALFTAQQSNAVRDAAEIVGWRPLELLEEGRAAGHLYAFQRTSSAIANVMLADIGHCNTQVTILRVDGHKIAVLAEACDQNLGGRDFDEVLFQHFVSVFENQYKVDVCSNAKASVKLRTACEKAKRVLSANMEAEIEIDCLVGEIDVKGVITREKFDELSRELLGRIESKLEDGLRIANLNVRNIHSVELIGSGSRVPSISKTIKDMFGYGVSRTLNGSECIACGCALRCDELLTNYKRSGNGYTDPRSRKNPNGTNRKDWREARENEMILAKHDRMVEEAKGRRNSLEGSIYNLLDKLRLNKNIHQSKLEKSLKEMEDWISEKQNIITESEYNDKVNELTEIKHLIIDNDGDGRVNDNGGGRGKRSTRTKNKYR